MATAASAERAGAAQVLRALPAWTLTAALALVWLALDPPTPDLAAHEYRAALAERVGFAVWEQGWFGGHHLPGYSVLMPPLAALLSPQLVAAAGVVAAAWCFERLAGAHWARAAARAASVWFAVGAVSTLLGGQLAFAAGLAPALGALLAAGRGRAGTGALLGALTTLTSPGTAAFLVLACAAWWLDRRGRAPLAVAAGTVVPGLLILLAFPQGGTQPFEVSSFAWAFLVAAGFAAALPRRERTLRIGAALYALVLLLGVLFDTPLGGNLVRLAAVFGGPLAAGALWEQRRRLLYLIAVPLLYWQWLAPVRSAVRGAGDPSAKASYHEPLLAELDRRAAAEGPFRAHVPFTANHWETRFIPLRHPLARGWERQLDVKLNPLFYEQRPLTPVRYRAWLDELAVRYVALSDVKLDPAGKEEGALVKTGQVPGLRPVWRSRHWRLYEVVGSRPLASPPVTATRLGPDSIELTTPRPATTTLRIRHSPYLALTRGAGCVWRAPGGWTRLRLTVPGPARLDARFSLERIRAGGERCSD
jgi:hypothetical protein